jgi:hypothetical protein
MSVQVSVRPDVFAAEIVRFLVLAFVEDEDHD